MAPRDEFNRILEYKSKWDATLERALAPGGKGIDLEIVRGKFDLLLQTLKVSEASQSVPCQQLIELHDTYRQALEKAISLYENNSREQAKEYFEGEFKEKSLNLTTGLLKCIACLNQEELERYETL